MKKNKDIEQQMQDMEMDNYIGEKYASYLEERNPLLYLFIENPIFKKMKTLKLRKKKVAIFKNDPLRVLEVEKTILSIFKDHFKKDINHKDFERLSIEESKSQTIYELFFNETCEQDIYFDVADYIEFLSDFKSIEDIIKLQNRV